MENPKLTVGNGNAVIMVDDNEEDRFIARHCFQKAGLNNSWLEFTGGLQALKHLDSIESGQNPMPAVALLDINMPHMNGFELVEAIRARSYFIDLSIVVMLTSSQNATDVQQAKKLGVTKYITKPIDLDEYMRFFVSLAST